MGSNKEKIIIPGQLISGEPNGIVVATDMIKDTGLNDKQDSINSRLNAEIGTFGSRIQELKTIEDNLQDSIDDLQDAITENPEQAASITYGKVLEALTNLRTLTQIVDSIAQQLGGQLEYTNSSTDSNESTDDSDESSNDSNEPSDDNNESSSNSDEPAESASEEETPSENQNDNPEGFVKYTERGFSFKVVTEDQMEELINTFKTDLNTIYLVKENI